MTTMFLSAFSGCRAISAAAWTAAADDMPTSRPSVAASCRPGPDRIVVTDPDDAVHDRRVEVGGHEAGADSLYLVRSRFASRQDGRGVRFDGEHPHIRLQFLEPPAGAADRSACAHAGDQYIDLSVRVAPDLFGGRLFVDAGIGRIGELLQDDRTRDLVAECFGPGDGAFHAFGSGRQLQPCAEGLEQTAALQAHRVGHRQDQFVSFDRRDTGQSDARVAAGGFDDRGSGREEAFLFGVFDHRQGDPLFDASQRVEIFQFAEQAAAQRVHTAVGSEFQKGSIADQVGQFFRNFRHGRNRFFESQRPQSRFRSRRALPAALGTTGEFRCGRCGFVSGFCFPFFKLRFSRKPVSDRPAGRRCVPYRWTGVWFRERCPVCAVPLRRAGSASSSPDG